MAEALEPSSVVPAAPPSAAEAWQVICSQLRGEMNAGEYNSWVMALRPLGCKEGVYRLGTVNSYCRDWVESRLRKRILGLLEVIYLRPLQLQVVLSHDFSPNLALDDDPPAPLSSPAPRGASPAAANGAAPRSPEQKLNGGSPRGAAVAVAAAKETAGNRARANGQPAPLEETADPAAVEGGSARKIQLQRAYGSARARVIQPERGMFLTMYFFQQWLPLLGQSVLTTIIAARSMCYWNPMTGELRNVVETDMSELARRASVSVRTVKDVLNNDLVRRYFLRYRVRRVMTSNGIRTAGIVLQVRMDDPLTPEDQQAHKLAEEEHWFSADFDDEA